MAHNYTNRTTSRRLLFWKSLGKNAIWIDMKICKNRILSCSADKAFSSVAKGLLFEASGIFKDSMSLNFVENGEYSFEWPTAGKCRGRFLKIISNKEIVFSWLKSNSSYSANEFKTEVRINFSAQGENACLELTHCGFPHLEAYESHNKGWDDVLDDFAKKCV